MKITLEIPDYDGQYLIFDWDKNSMVEIEIFRDIVHIKANKTGLVSLAKNMLYLALSVKPERHYHYDISNCGTGFHGNHELVISRSDEWDDSVE